MRLTTPADEVIELLEVCERLDIELKVVDGKQLGSPDCEVGKHHPELISRLIVHERLIANELTRRNARQDAAT